MGIVLMSAPMLVSTSTNSGYTSNQQELIAAASTHLSMILSREWDEQNTLGLQRAHVLNTNTSLALALNAVAGARAGTPTIGKHRIYVNHLAASFNATPIPAGIVADADDIGIRAFDDIDDYNAVTVNLVDNTAGLGRNNAGDYLDPILNINTVVNYLNATPTIQATYNTAIAGLNYDNPAALAAGLTSDIKGVQVNLIRNALLNPGAPRELDANIVFRAFSCNIGSYQLEELPL
jgi:hypothetical protein